ncbi:MAG: class I SAM-dependent methyltransferase [Pseudomonadota bacterium]
MSSSPEARQRPIRITLRDMRDYLLYRIPLARVIHDRSVLRYLPRLRGRALELGAGRHDYSAYALETDAYIRSDYQPDTRDDRIAIDATAIDFPDASFDSIICMSALEHICDYPAALAEMHRVLKPGGQLLLCVPWLFPYHGAPDDYHRFTASALRVHLAQFEITEFEAVGNYWLSLAMFLQRPIWSRPAQNKRSRFYDPLLRAIGVVFLLAGRNRSARDDNYALLYTCLCRKPENGKT